MVEVWCGFDKVVVQVIVYGSKLNHLSIEICVLAKR
jgi:hypothetical protein